jgi:hypothetical protein
MVGAVDAIVCSPPYAEAVGSPALGGWRRAGWGRGGDICARQGLTADYGTTPGQLGGLRVGEPDAGEGADVDVPTLDWTGCYAQGWGRDVLVPPAMSHPAKFARGLLTRLFDHGFKRGWWAKGSLVADPFAGVACGGIVAAYKGLRFVGVELEPKFHALALANVALHRASWEAMGDPVPVCLLGDSRRFAELVAGCGAVLTSLPYAGIVARGGTSVFEKPPRPGDVRQARRKPELAPYGATPGQIGTLPAGDVGAVVTSPPWADGGMGDERFGGGLKDKSPVALRATGGGGLTDYGAAPGQVGRESGETYWTACKQIYLECLKCLKPGGVLACVVKGYVRDGALVDLPGQTLRLLRALGFEPVERIRAWLTEERREAGLFGEVVTTKSRQSFFRRLAEKRGAPPIRWEEVLVVRKED